MTSMFLIVNNKSNEDEHCLTSDFWQLTTLKIEPADRLYTFVGFEVN